MVEKREIGDKAMSLAANDAAVSVNVSPMEDPTSEEIADYIADMLQELRDLATTSGQGALVLLLEMAQREARSNTQKKASVPRGSLR